MNEETTRFKQRSARDEHNRKKLRHGKADNRESAAEIMKNRREVLKGRKRSHKELYIGNKVLEKTTERSDEQADDNAGIQALFDGVFLAEEVVDKTTHTAVYEMTGHTENHESVHVQKIKDSLYSRKMSDVWTDDLMTNDALGSSNIKSKELQKKNIRRSYMNSANKVEDTRRESGRAAAVVSRIVETIKDFITAIGEKIASNPHILIIIAIAVLIVAILAVTFTSCNVLAASMGNSMSATSFTAYDEDIVAVNNLYTAKEEALQQQIANIPTTHPGYDEYEYFLDEIGHNPYELAAYLTVKFEDYKKAQVRSELDSLFTEQYKLTTTPRTETRTRTVTVDGQPVTESYTVRILTVKLENKILSRVIAGRLTTSDEQNRYNLLLSMKGNKDYLFDDIYTDYDNPDEYHVPGSALSDQQFARMISVGELFLGRKYVWGGSTPSTGFDCSGFVSYVINHSGWNVGRRSAAGLRALCTIIPESEARPGDLIFFKGTYNTSGASHVGIYVGNGMMLHCGNPIQYTSIETNYWRNHFFGFGRLPDPGL